ncbi:MAG: hypothetical protein IJH50_01125, partial [Kiritimatiellae bacterium]|nr:hypothetical protein [Kiritimatiellia bacterium]
TRVRRRVAVLRNPPQAASVCSASAAKPAAHGTFWRSSRRTFVLDGAVRSRYRSPSLASRAIRRRLRRDAASRNTAPCLALASAAVSREPACAVSLRSKRPASSRSSPPAAVRFSSFPLRRCSASP